MVMEPWDALDVDDSDLPTLLRPCKRRRSPSPTSSAAANPLSQPLSSQAQPENPLQQQQQPPASTSTRSTIPGPAGAVHAAMLRKTLDRKNQNFTNYTDDEDDCCNGGGHGVVSTQEYIKRAMEDTAEFDDDFTRNPWLSALQSLRVRGGETPTTPISSIKKCLNSGKVDQIVAVIKSCTPNGLGGLMVTLKDPTGTVGASIHHKVLSESDYGKSITVGAVVVLHSVALFAPARSAQYLNITLRNLLKVFCQDSAAAVRKDNSADPARYADPGTDNRGKAQVVEEISSMQNIALEETTKDIRQNMERRQNTQNNSAIHIQKKMGFAGSSQSNDGASSNVTAASRQVHSESSRDVCNRMPGDVISTQTTGNLYASENGSAKGTKESTSEGILNHTPVAFVSNSDALTTSEETQGTNEVKIQRQPLIVNPTLPQWTDEQLDELFAGDEDDGSLF